MVIPKIIHYCWFGNRDMSDTAKQCIETWRNIMPDYEIILWNENNFPYQNYEFTHQAYKLKKFAFVSDVARFYALKKYGGIYLDTDMYVIKRFDDLINLNFFAGFESSKKNKSVNAAIVGAIKDQFIINEILEFYKDLNFNPQQPLSIPFVITKILKRHGLKENNKTQELADKIWIFSSDYFYPMPFSYDKDKNIKQYITKNTYAIHLWEFSWNNGLGLLRQNRFKEGIRYVLKTLRENPFQPLSYYKEVFYHLFRLFAFKLGKIYNRFFS